jgi:hypothetical protein
MTAIDIAEMPVSEKLKLMEALWDSLCVRTDGSFESPAWHEQALKQAEDDLAAGTARFVDWAEAKNVLRSAQGSTGHF